MSSDEAFVSAADANAPETNQNVALEDRRVEESEATGKISKDEVEGLKDTIGGGQVLDDSEGYTRSSNKDVSALKQEDEVDAAVADLE
ncbi:hypothetical protein I302_106970 [Kwoniella bestiolae CBS 10118]|uniref:Uncharacterized protein n=1 Tax=Kwoniella bestiolae CBS 10118 TaxID=1296100 RepID=A0A1B9FZW0_9TREE|nr:hypothetical protein I302_05766 [Kwoniella bestiolae CBS 10118]OCF24307.1 hypothetical protein I302_05766 [Kwoniella bestiolae CBS 10118]